MKKRSDSTLKIYFATICKKLISNDPNPYVFGAHIDRKRIKPNFLVLNRKFILHFFLAFLNFVVYSTAWIIMEPGGSFSQPLIDGIKRTEAF